MTCRLECTARDLPASALSERAGMTLSERKTSDKVGHPHHTTLWGDHRVEGTQDYIVCSDALRITRAQGNRRGHARLQLDNASVKQNSASSRTSLTDLCHPEVMTCLLRDSGPEIRARDVIGVGLAEMPSATGNRQLERIAHVARPLSRRIRGRKRKL